MENMRGILEPESLADYTRISALQGSGRVCKALPGQRATPPTAKTSSLS